MPRKTKNHGLTVSAPLRELIRAEVDRVIANGTPIEAMTVCRAIRDEWQKAASDGDRGLERDIWSEIVPVGIWRTVDPYVREEYGTALTANGKVIKQPRRQAIAARDDAGIKTGEVQRMYWEEWTWEQYAEMVDRRKRQAARLNERIIVMEYVLSLRAKYPDTAHPADAMRREGLDPADFAIDRAA